MKKAADIIVDCLKEKDMSQRKLAAGMGEDVRNINQQLHRYKDIKAGRFADILEHIGYRVEIIDNGGIRKVCGEYAGQIVRTGKPEGLFWTFADGIYTAIDSTHPEVFCEDFQSKEECFWWLRYEEGADGGHERSDDGPD